MKLFIGTFFLLLTGCANVAPMAVDKQTKSLDVNSKSIVLMTVDLSRPEPSRYIPHPLWIDFTKKGSPEKSERLVFRVDKDAGNTSSEIHNKFLLRIALEPGQYELKTIFGNANAFPFNGFFQVPLLEDINILPNTVTYVGRVNALMRPRVGEEFRAGSVIPLIDQAATGVSGSTFEVNIVDAAEEEVPEFKAAFSVLANVEIQKSILPPFDRAKAQTWWETDGNIKEPRKQTTDTSHSASN